MRLGMSPVAVKGSLYYGNIFGLYSEGDRKPYVGFELVTNKINPVLKNKNKQTNKEKHKPLCLQPGTWMKSRKTI